MSFGYIKKHQKSKMKKCQEVFEKRCISKFSPGSSNNFENLDKSIEIIEVPKDDHIAKENEVKEINNFKRQKLIESITTPIPPSGNGNSLSIFSGLNQAPMEQNQKYYVQHWDPIQAKLEAELENELVKKQSILEIFQGISKAFDSLGVIAELSMIESHSNGKLTDEVHYTKFLDETSIGLLIL